MGAFQSLLLLIDLMHAEATRNFRRFNAGVENICSEMGDVRPITGNALSTDCVNFFHAIGDFISLLVSFG